MKEEKLYTSEEVMKRLENIKFTWWDWVVMQWNQLPYRPREIKWWLQKKFRGYGDNDLWALDDLFVRTMRKPFKTFVAMERLGYPEDQTNGPKTPEEWEEILKKIELAFDLYYEYNMDFDAYDKKKEGKTKEEWIKLMIEDQKKILEGFKLFGKYVESLWD
jgi:hypothetical protein